MYLTGQVRHGDVVNLGVTRALVHVYKTEGAVGFFKGNGVNLARMVPYSAIQFAAYEYFKEVCIWVRMWFDQFLTTARRDAFWCPASVLVTPLVS